ncbi:hypothetical protein Fmac_005395 [Flemingia macrophylla]|uniref:Uncharacterized protein n=1 Tax=Flemingia macrophylla TaxID=520843 RepID=A0ABD1N7R1_9FABA
MEECINLLDISVVLIQKFQSQLAQQLEKLHKTVTTSVMQQKATTEGNGRRDALFCINQGREFNFEVVKHSSALDDKLSHY